MFHCGLLGLVKVHLDQTRAVQLDSDSLANDLSGEAQVFQDVVMNHGQGATEDTRSNIEDSVTAGYKL